MKKLFMTRFSLVFIGMMISTMISYSQTTISIPISKAGNDAEEIKTSIARELGRMRTVDASLDLAFDTDPQYVGLQFNWVEIPVGAVVTNAYIQFTVADVIAGQTDAAIDLEIYGAKAVESSSIDWVYFSISSVPSTDATVAWSPAPSVAIDDAGINEQTSDLSSILNEIIAGDAWAFGNNVMLTITGDAARTVKANRIMKSYDNAPENAPVLNITYIVPEPKPEATIYNISDDEITIDGAGDDAIWSMITANPIDRASNESEGTPTYTSATWKAAYSSTGVYVVVEVEDDYWFPSFVATSMGDWLTDKPEIYFDCSVPLADGLGTKDNAGNWQIAPDFSENDAGVKLDVNAADNSLLYSYSHTWDGAGAYTAEYYVTYAKLLDADDGIQLDPAARPQIGFDVSLNDLDAVDGPTSYQVWSNTATTNSNWANLDDAGLLNFSTEILVAPGSKRTLSIPIIREDNDAEEIKTSIVNTLGRMRTTDPVLDLAFGSDPQYVGLQFNEVQIPVGAIVTNAYIQFVVAEVVPGQTDAAIDLEIYGAKEVTADALGWREFSISSVPSTDAIVPWSPAPSVAIGDAGTDEQTPDLSSILNEITAGDAWASGNNVMITITGDADRTVRAARSMESFRDNPELAPVLNITYIVPLPKREATIYNISDDEITIDGTGDDAIWDMIDAMPIDRASDESGATPTYTSATWKAAYSSTGVYVVVEVEDDYWFPSFVANRPNWETDKPEIYFDCSVPLADGLGTKDNNGNWQIAPDFSENEAGVKLDVNAADNSLLYSYSHTWDGAGAYTAEYFVSYAQLLDADDGTQLDPAARPQIGFDVSLNDLDAVDGPTSYQVWNNTATTGSNWANLDDAGLLNFSTETLVVPPPKREATIYNISDDDITIDGAGDDAIWDMIDAMPIDRASLQGGATPTYTSATWKAAYSSTGVYVVLEVEDDYWFPAFVANRPNWETDKPEIYFDCSVPLADGLGTKDNNGNWQIAPDFSENEAGVKLDVNAADNSLLYSYSHTWDGAGAYTAEYYVTYAKLLDADDGIQLDPAARPQIGFDVTLNDLDAVDGTTAHQVWNNTATTGTNWANLDDAGLLNFSTETLVVPPPKREATIYNISDDEVSIDGAGDDPIWDMIDAMPIDRASDELEGTPTYTSATWKAAYSSTGVYVVLEVEDDYWFPSFVANRPHWETDKPEIYFDCSVPLADGLGTKDNNGNWQIAPDFSEDEAGVKIDKNAADNSLLYSYSHTWDGLGAYTAEYFVTYAQLLDADDGTQLDPAARPQIGFDVALNDLDAIDGPISYQVWNNTATTDSNWANMDDAGLLNFSTEILSTGISKFADHSIMVYPSPATTFINIKADNIKRVNIINSVGVTVKMVNSNVNYIDISDIATGLYFVKIATENETVVTKIIKK